MTDFLQHYKIQKKLSTDSQILLMDHKGQFKASCNALFPTDHLKNTSLLDWSPFLESIFSNIQQIKANKPFEIKCIQSNIRGLSGFYDYHFQMIKVNGNNLILWQITDKTSFYKALQKKQQIENDRHLKNE